MSLRTLLTGCIVAILLLALGVGAIQFNRGLSQYSQTMSAMAVKVRGAALADSLGRALAEEWTYVAGFADRVDPGQSAEDLQAAIDGYRDPENKISWAGLARTDGTVVAASDGMLVGESVGQRPWFQRGLEGPFAGDAHEAVLLADLIAPEAEIPPRFVDFSLPVTNMQGQVRGVFGIHIDLEWVRNLLAEMAGSLDLDAFVVDRSGDIVMSTDPAVDAQSVQTLASFRAANLVNSGAYIEQWPDGADYYSFIMPEVGFVDVPSFGWSLVLRLDPAPFAEAQSRFARFMLMGGGLIGLAGILAIILVLTLLLRPLSGLIDATSRLSKGEDIGFVPGLMSYREVTRLSNALARFQTRDADRRKNRRPDTPPE
ncbi:MAG: hypothetical protein CML24_04780 [Rhizobiales bacterium]|nr:hypothetical protein [Hyphomicrobiales bacterium]